MAHNTVDTVEKIAGATFVGMAISMADVEQGLRIVSLCIGLTLSIVAFIRNERWRKKQQQDNEQKNS